MAEYIDLDTPLEVYVGRGSFCEKRISTLRDLLDTNKIPYTAADVRPVVRGKWEDNTKDGGWKCSECGFISYSIGFYKRYNTKFRMRFCPNCGADMKEES